MITLVVPFIDTFDDFVVPVIKHAVDFSRAPFELLMVDNGSDRSYEADIKKMLGKMNAISRVQLNYIRNEQNPGIIVTFNQAVDKASTDIICFIHSDVLLQEEGWERKIENAFDNDPHLGLAGLLGAGGVGYDGGRMGTVSNMRGDEWGKCSCHQLVSMHHGNFSTGISAAAVLDGVGLFFRRACFDQIRHSTDALDPEVRPPHHWYDRNLTLYAITRGWHVSVIGVGFDHWSGATANTSEKYRTTAREWLEKYQPDYQPKDNVDLACYNVGLKQFTREWAPYLPCLVNGDYQVQFTRQPQ